MADTSDSQIGYLAGTDDANDSLSGFLKGGGSGTDSIQLYTIGATSTLDDILAYLAGRVASLDNISSYLAGTSPTVTDYLLAYLTGIVRSSVSGYLEGTNQQAGEGVAPFTYMRLVSSDGGWDYKFRVIASGYNDGEDDRAESVKRTIGGGIDHSVGAVYRTWNPKIKVRHTESESGYGNLSQLQAFYSLNPNETPSNDITFVDHHGTSYTVHIVGPFKKALLGSMIEGGQAWSIVQLNLLKVA